MCGIGDTSSYELVLPDLALNISGNQPGYPFFQRFIIDSLQIQNERLLVDRNYKPKLAWYTDAGMVNNDPSVIYKNLGMSFGLSMSFPVFDGNQRKLNVEKLANSELTRQNYREFFRIQYSQELRQLNESLKRTRDLIPRLEKHLPDGTMVPGHVKSRLPAMNNSSQTQRYIIQPATMRHEPENLSARVRIVKKITAKAVSLPKVCILSNEVQQQFWVMKLINDSVAVKVVVKPGLQSHDRIEITDPLFTPADRFLASGNYGLGDTAKVIIQGIYKNQ